MKKNVIEIRRELHQIPELDHDLPKTLSYIDAFLAELNCHVSIPAPSSRCAFFNFNQSQTLAFRADMDALPISEALRLPYASMHAGHMHACGHDGHMAMLLAFAQELTLLSTCNYNIALIFQPAEETQGGAKDICDSHILDSLNVRAIFGIHLWPALPKGMISTKAGALMAKSCEIQFDLYGKGTHIAAYDQGIDSLSPAVQLLDSILKKYPSNPHYLLKFGYVNSGTAANCISSHTVIKGSLRTYEKDTHEQIIKELGKLAENLERKSGCHIYMQTSTGYPPLRNDSALYEKISKYITIQPLSHGNFYTDDFAYYTSLYPGIYFYLGTGMNIPLHSDHFQIDEATLAYGVELYKQLIAIPFDKET